MGGTPIVVNSVRLDASSASSGLTRSCQKKPGSPDAFSQEDHDLALPLLQKHATDAAALHLDIRFQGSVDSLRALNEGQCLVAGFHTRGAGCGTDAFQGAQAAAQSGLAQAHRLLSTPARPSWFGAARECGVFVPGSGAR
jgi:hypothetical protein